ncbi:MAG: hypothetical protein IPK19_38875 [Chloroflexi bacterium]|nr:hypothetical protein [Chloroflexota bacterium]
MIACVYIPYFTPALLGERGPLIVVRHFKRRGKVIACSPDAERMGVRRDLAVSRARALCPKAVFVSADDAAFAEAQEKLLNVLWTFTNRVEIDSDAYPHHAIAYLDLGSLRATDACLLGEEMVRMLREVFRVGASVGLAAGKLTAFLAAQNAPRGTIRRVGGEVGWHEAAAFIAPFPAEALPLLKEEARRLHLLGIETLGDLAALPRGSIASSFGRRGALLHRLASGLDGRPVIPAKMPQQETARSTFDAIRDRDRLDYRLSELIERLGRTLERRSAAAHRLILTVQVERGAAQTETLRLLEPVGGPKALREAADRLLARLTLSRPVVGVELCAAHLVPAAARQLELFGERPVSRGVIDLTRLLAARYGTEEFYTAAAGQTGSLLIERRYVRRQVTLEEGS